MAVLQSTNVQGTLCVNGVAVGGGKDFKYCCFTASTTFTPSQDLVDGNGVIDTTALGGGGGGGSVHLYTSADNSTNLCLCVESLRGSTGGGAEVINGITDITATDACSVTIGAGGTSVIAGLNPGLINCNCRWWTCVQYGNTPGWMPSSSIATGGDSEFGDITALGGGGGGQIIGVATCNAEIGNQILTYKCITDGLYAERNGGKGFTSAGGGADFTAQNWQNEKNCVYGYSIYGTQGIATNCCVVRDCSILAAPNHGDNFFGNSVTYSFSPPICDYDLGVMRYGNDGVELGNKTRVGTNKHSIFETCPVKCCFIGATSINSCHVDFTASAAAWCGGGGGTSCIGMCGEYSPNNPNCLRAFGGPGGDGLVILKWFE